MKRILYGIGRALGATGRATVALVGICGVVAMATNYTMTQGAGTSFGSIVVGGVNYVQHFLCDLTTPAQCASVSAGGAVKVDNSAVTQPVSSATFGTAANQTTINTSIGTTNTTLTSTNTKLDTIITNTGAAIPAGSAYTGQSSPDPSKGGATPAFANLALPATTTTQIVALSGTTVTYVTSLHFMSSGAVNLTLKYGTGSNCGTGTTTLAGPYPLAAQAGMAIGSGSGAILIVPSGKALCVTTDASMTGAVGLTYQQF